MGPTVCSSIASRAYAGALVLAAVLAGCVGDDGTSRRPKRLEGAEPASQGPAAPRVLWEHAAQLASLRTVRERVRSTHFVDGAEAVIRANEAAAAYGKHGAVLPPGSLLVVSHEGAAGIAQLAMAKTAGPDSSNPRWDYVVADGAGWVVQRGRIPSCVRCHEEAPSDEVFGPPGL